MKAQAQIKRTRGVAWGLTYALLLSAILTFGVACTRDKNNGTETGTGASTQKPAVTSPVTPPSTTPVTTPATTPGTSGTATREPEVSMLDPDAGKVTADENTKEPNARWRK